jgi:hypothetical protein
MPKFTKETATNHKKGKDHSWARISFWIDRINAEWPHLTPNQKTHYSVELTKLLISKAKALPISPEESLLNAGEALSQLKQIESKSNSEVKKD